MTSLLLLLVSLSTLVHAETLILSEATPSGLRITIEIDGYQIQPENEVGFTEIFLEGAPSQAAAGQPILPAISRFIDLPDHAACQVEILQEDWSAHRGVLAPEQERVRRPEDFPAPFEQDPAIYSSDLTFPATALQLGAPALLRNQRFCQLTLNTARCNPLRERFETLNSMELLITFEGLDERNAKTFDLAQSAGFWHELLEPGRLVPRESMDRDLYDLRETPGAYMVVARNSAITADPYFNAWLDWKREKGHEVFIVDENAVGSWTASNIKNYLADAYENSDTPPDFVLLIGDPSASGNYELPIGGSGYSGTYDHFYSTLEGTDIFADVAVGRISAENTSQMQGIFYKLMLYETTPYLAGTNWMSSAALTTGWNAISMIQQSRTIVHDMVEDGITQVDTLWYPNSDAGDVNNWFNQGIGLYNYRGWIGMDGLSTSYIDNSSNFTNDGMPPVAAIYTCSTGSFEGYSQTEALLRKGDIAHPRGAVATMGFATSNTHTAYNNAVCGGFWSAFLDHNLVQVGPAMFFGKLTLAQTLPPGDSNAEHFSNWANLMGDPGMDMWVGVPQTLSALASSGSNDLPYGQSSVIINVEENGSPCAGACVSLYQEGFLREIAVTDASGQAELSLVGHALANIPMTVTKADCMPVRSELRMMSQNLYASLSDAGISGDALAQPGESFILNPVIVNTGTQNLNLLTASLSLDASFGTILDGSGTWASIAPGAQAASSGSYRVQIYSDLQAGDLLPLNFHITAAGGLNMDAVLLVPVSAPLLVAQAASFSPGGSVMPAIGDCTLSLTLGNQGTLNATDLDLVLMSDDPFIQITDGAHNGFTAAVASSAVASFDIEVLTGAVRGHQVDLTLFWSGMGLSGSKELQLSIASPTAEGPTGPDAYGYVAIESDDYNTLSPVYNWVEIATPAGGNGTNLHLTDSGDSQDDAATVQLPFDFTYYGESYNEMAVCSNGFVAFEEGAVNQTDYRNHYLPTGLGPDAMIAPMWDDFTMPGGSDADVFWKYDTGLDAVIVEWYRMNHNGSGGINTFELILYNPESYPTESGDAPFAFQYHTWSNTQSNNYDFPGATVGIKDHFSQTGLCLSNYQIDAATSVGFSNQKAILFGTDEGEFDANEHNPPSIQLSLPGAVQPGETALIQASISDASGVIWAEMSWRMNGGSWTTQSMTHAGGDLYQSTVPAFGLGSIVDIFVEAADAAPEPNIGTSTTHSYTVVNGTPPTGPDGHGYFVYESTDGGEGQTFSWIDISSLGSNLGLDDDQTSVIDLPFDIIYWGQSFSQISVCSNGFVALGYDTSAPYSHSQLASSNGSSNMICGLWTDLNPSSGGSVRAYSDAASGLVVLAWINVPHYGSGTTETFEIIFGDPALYATVTGDSPFLIQYQSVGDASSCTIGHQNGSRNDGIQIAYNNSWASDLSPISDASNFYMTTGTAALEPVGDLDAVIEGSALELSWTPTGAPAYRIYSSTQAYGAFTTLEASTSNNRWETSLDGARWFQVRASTAAVRSEVREMRVVTTVRHEK
jgi:hypothetical protein